MHGAGWLPVVFATLLGCAAHAEPPRPAPPDHVQTTAFGLRFQVSATVVTAAAGYGVRVRVEVVNPGDAARELPLEPLVLSGVFGAVRADGEIEERGGGFAEEPMPKRGSKVVPARGTLLLERAYPEGRGRWLSTPGEALLLTVAIDPPLRSDSEVHRKDLADVSIGIPISGPPPFVRVTSPTEEAP